MPSNTIKTPRPVILAYLLKSNRSVKNKGKPEVVQMEVEDGESSDSHEAPKIWKQSSCSSMESEVEKKCVICDRAREGGGDRSRLLYHISESDQAALFLDAINFYNDEVKTRCVFLSTAGDVFLLQMSSIMGTACNSIYSSIIDKLMHCFKTLSDQTRWPQFI